MYSGVSKGFRLMFYSGIALLICPLLGVLFAFPVFAVLFIVIVKLACGIVSWVGIYKVSASLEDAKPAFVLAIINTVVSFIQKNISGLSFTYIILGIAGTVLAASVIYYIVKVTSSELAKNGNSDMERKGNVIWILCLVVSGVTALVYLLIMLRLVGAYAKLFTMLASIVGLVMEILYLIYLYSAGKAFDELDLKTDCEPV